MKEWKHFLREDLIRRNKMVLGSPALLPLISNPYNEEEIFATVDVLLSGQLTMGEKVKEFEKKFASLVGSKYAIMVNSGSSANLLAVASVSNPQNNNRIYPGDEVLIPAICWPTTLWPVVQMGLKPIFVDVDPTVLNMDLKDLLKKVTSKTKAIFLVHTLGNSSPMSEVMDIVNDYGLILLEDTCESLGATANGKFLGTFGSMGTYSFYYSHHITTGEGGMVVCETQDDNDLLCTLRAHGWHRESVNRNQYEDQNPAVDPRFLFINTGYNFRPTEVQAAFGLCQLKKFNGMNKIRKDNRKRLLEMLCQHPLWEKQLCYPQASKGTEPNWFGIPILLKKGKGINKKRYLEFLSANGIQNRPIITGNIARQPCLKLFDIECRPEDFPGAEEISDWGFFIGSSIIEISDKDLSKIADLLLRGTKVT